MIYELDKLKSAELFNGMHKVKLVGKMFYTGLPTYVLKSHEEIYVLEVNTYKGFSKLEKFPWKEDFEKFLSEHSSDINKLYNIDFEMYPTKQHEYFSSNIITIKEGEELPFGYIELEENFKDYENIVRDEIFLESIYDNKTLNEKINEYIEKAKKDEIQRITGYLEPSSRY